jgi:hypothetical protein
MRGLKVHLNTKNNFRTLNIYEIEVILPSPLTEDFFYEKNLFKGELSAKI